MNKCFSCGLENEPGANFCESCGVSLHRKELINTRVCMSCGKTNEGIALFCDGCGKPLNQDQIVIIQEESPKQCMPDQIIPQENLQDEVPDSPVSKDSGVTKSPTRVPEKPNLDLFSEFPGKISKKTEDELNFIKIFANYVQEKKFKQEFAQKLFTTQKKLPNEKK